MIRPFFTIILFLLAALPVAAQTGTASLGGRVTDENGAIEGVTVVAIHQQTNAQYYATTGRGGWWQLVDVLPGGPYTLRIHYFGYDPLTVRNVFTYAGQNTVVDADLEAKTSYVHVDEAATSLRLGPELGGGAVPVSPLGYDLVSQRIYTPVAFDVRQESPLAGASQQWIASVGSNRFHGSAYGFYGHSEWPDFFSSSSLDAPAAKEIRNYGIGGLNIATPLGSQDYQLFGGLQYGATPGRSGMDALSGAARLDARLNESFRLDLSGGRLAIGSDGYIGSTGESWIAAGLTSSLAEQLSMRFQAGWYKTGDSRQLLASDDFTYVTGRHRMLAGVQFSYQNFMLADSTSTHGDIYVQDAIRLGRRLTLLAGVRFSIPFAFSPRVSMYYDMMGDGRLVLRAGTAVYGRRGEGTIWKNLAAFDLRLPLAFKLTFEGIYGQSWRRPFYISTRNVLGSHYALTARLERPFANSAWVLASYTRSDGSVRDRVLGGFSFRGEYLGHLATTLSVLYDGGSVVDNLSPASLSWTNAVEARLSQDIFFQAAGRTHTIQLTGYCRYATSGAPVSSLFGAPSLILPSSVISFMPGSAGYLTLLFGLRYFL